MLPFRVRGIDGFAFSQNCKNVFYLGDKIKIYFDYTMIPISFYRVERVSCTMPGLKQCSA